MSLRKLSSKYGADAVFALDVPPPWIAGLCLAVALFGFYSATTDRAAMKDSVGLAVGFGVFMLFLAFVFYRLRSRAASQRARVRIGATKFFSEHESGQGPVYYEAALSEFTRGLVMTQGSATWILGERTDGGMRVTLVSQFQHLRGGTYPSFLEVFNRRAALCRAGVSSKPEMRAAEAFLNESARGASPFGIGVGKQKPTTLWALESPDDLDAARREDLTVYLPERAYKAIGDADERVKILHLP